MLATLTDDVFSDDDWIFERKFDGERVLAVHDGSQAFLLSRTGRTLDRTYPEIKAAVTRSTGHRLVIDGEIVAFEGGLTSFSRLQRRMGLTRPQDVRQSTVAVYYYVFDLLHLDGHDTTRLPLRTRKRLLRSAVTWQSPLFFTQHRNADGAEYFAAACQRGWEGVIAKRGDAPYRPGRGRSWLKLKCVDEQEFVIGGFTPPRGSRVGFGALLVGYFERGRLRYAGKVGTGYDTATLRSLRSRLDGLRRDASPFAERVNEKDSRWVTPELVAEVGFSEWTNDQRLRHPRFLGLRRDKPATEVVRERPQPR
ncbi:non-homologous end-joining DNA ligase [Spiractinospora alimapuensis]|nr:non-homologous end-joining DNA ligase [Spiractinospora alimapuensis]